MKERKQKTHDTIQRYLDTAQKNKYDKHNLGIIKTGRSHLKADTLQ